MVSFYDFDQDFADGANAYIRESMTITNFTAMLYTSTTELEVNFSTTVETNLRAQYGDSVIDAITSGLQTSGQYHGGLLPVETFVKWPATEDRRLALVRPRGWAPGTWPPTNPNALGATDATENQMYINAVGAMYDFVPDASKTFEQIVHPNFPTLTPGAYFVTNPTGGGDGAELGRAYSSGVIVRSTSEGIGPPKYPKLSWIGCQGDCADGLTPSGAVCNMDTYTCGGNWNGATPSGGSCSGSDTRCGAAESRFTTTAGRAHMTGAATPFWTGCGFRDNGQANFAPNTPIGLFGAPQYHNSTGSNIYGASPYFTYPALCPAADTPGHESYPATPQSLVASVSNPIQSQYYVQTGADPTGFVGTASTSVWPVWSDPGLYDDNVACVLDCPRTVTSYDGLPAERRTPTSSLRTEGPQYPDVRCPHAPPPSQTAIRCRPTVSRRSSKIAASPSSSASARTSPSCTVRRLVPTF